MELELSVLLAFIFPLDAYREAEYIVRVFTSDLKDAEYQGVVRLWMYGRNGRQAIRELPVEDNKRGGINTIHIRTEDIGEPEQIRFTTIGQKRAFHVERIEIQKKNSDQVHVYNINRWLLSSYSPSAKSELYMDTADLAKELSRQGDLLQKFEKNNLDLREQLNENVKRQKALENQRDQVKQGVSKIKVKIFKLKHMEKGGFNCASDEPVRSFSQAYTRTPKVFVSVKGLDGARGDQGFYRLEVEDVTPANFTVTCAALGDTQVTSIWVDWISFTNVE